MLLSHHWGDREKRKPKVFSLSSLSKSMCPIINEKVCLKKIQGGEAPQETLSVEFWSQQDTYWPSHAHMHTDGHAHIQIHMQI